MHHPVLYQQLSAIAAPMRPPRNFSSPLLSLFLSHFLSLSFSSFPLPLSSLRFVASAATRSFSFRSRSPSARFSPFGSTFSPLFSRRCLSFISSVSAVTSLSTIRALVFARHSSIVVVVGPSHHSATLPNAEIPFYAHCVTCDTITSFTVCPVILMRIRSESSGGCSATERYDVPPVERRRKEPKETQRKAEQASVARIGSVKNGNRISIIS